MFLRVTTASVVVLALPAIVHATSYNLVKEYQGSSFFDDWEFYGNYDNLTNGDVNFATKSQASKNKLAYVNSAGNAIMKVDNTSTVTYNEKRNSIRISSNDRFGVGSVWMTDMVHVPYGCSVWPAWWSQAPDWPNGGEIDTFEGVNLITQNAMSLHTNPGCTITGAVQTSTLVNTTDCSYLANANSGCTVTDPSTASYGETFAATGGGVFVTEFATTGISIWFFARANIPSSISSGNASSIDTGTLGTPTANFPATNCASETFFNSQNLIFDITLCGDYAGNAATFAETCSGICYNDYVLGPASTYDNAYFEVQNVRVFGVISSTTSSALARAVPLGGIFAGLAVAAWYIV